MTVISTGPVGTGSGTCHDPDRRPLRRDAERNRQKVMAAAQALFAERGLEVSLDDIARRAGVGVGTVYRRFPSREALIEELFEDSLRELIADAQAAARAPDGWTGFAGFLSRACERFAADRGLREVSLSTAHGSDRCALGRQGLKPAVEVLVARAAAQGRLRDDVVALDVPVLLGMVLHVAGFARDEDPQLWRRYLQLLLDGLRAQRRRPTPLPREALDEDAVERVMSCGRSCG
ncbi:MAG TPA: TetR/AcrR family transcriptional regulator [Mycobacteriales bacterium]|nr:TetR/AcrR family transcriptional regulator [Mycobacteriales bacterium]